MEKQQDKTSIQVHEKWGKELGWLATIIDKALLEKTIKWGDVFTYNENNVVPEIRF
jgi:hypothetical protein